MPATVRILSNGAFTVPKHVRDRLDWKAGDQIEIVEHPEGIELRRIEPLPGKASR